MKLSQDCKTARLSIFVVVLVALPGQLDIVITAFSGTPHQQKTRLTHCALRSGFFGSMKFSLILATGIPVALAAWCPPKPADSFEQKQIFDLFVRTLLIDKNVEAAYYEHVSPDYIQHNPTVLTGRENSISVLTDLAPRANFTFYHTSVGSNIALLHHRIDWEDKAKHPTWTMAADIFRMDGTCVMEHWDCLGEAPEYGINHLPWISK